MEEAGKNNHTEQFSGFENAAYNSGSMQEKLPAFFLESIRKQDLACREIQIFLI